MAQAIVSAYTGRVSLEQVMTMPFDRIHGLYNEIVSRVNQSLQPQPEQQQHNQADIDQKMNDNDEKIDEYEQEIAALKQKNEEMQKRLDLLEGKQERVTTLDLDQLSDVKKTMQDSIRVIEEAEQKLVDNMRKCVVCLVNNKCMALDGCGHISLCEQCEARLHEKKCPICRAEKFSKNFPSSR